MKHLLIFLMLLVVIPTFAGKVDTIFFGGFGKVTVYVPDNTPEAVVLFISGDGGWNKGVIDMAKIVVAEGALLAGIDIRHYYKSVRSLKSKCFYPAGDLEELSMALQKKYKFSQYMKPILMGYSSGATLVYGALAQAPTNTFKAAISLGFCPDVEVSKPLCNGSGLSNHVLKENKAYYLEPARNLSAPFVILQGTHDQVCSYDDTKKYMEEIPRGVLISLPNVGHGFSVTRNWVPQFVSAFQKILRESGYTENLSNQNKLQQPQSPAPFTGNLPLTIIPSSSKVNLPLAFFISGDGGWTSFDQAVSEKLAENGMPVAGLDAQKYFWNKKQPGETADDITGAVEYYMKVWDKSSFVLIGYSFGACVVPFIASNFPEGLKGTLKGVYCFSPDEFGDFEIHISDMLNIKSSDQYNVLGELKKIKSLNPVCIFGAEEDPVLRNHFSANGIKVETLPGNHHYDNDYRKMAGIISRDFTGMKDKE